MTAGPTKTPKKATLTWDGNDDLVGDVDKVESAMPDVAVPEDEHPDDVDSSGDCS